MGTPSLSILSAGAVTSLGLTLPATAAAIRAAVDNFQETRFLDPKGELLMGARVDLCLPQEADGSLVGGMERLAHMVSLAVEECLADQSSGVSTALMLVLPEEARPIDSKKLHDICEGTCAERLGQRPAQVQSFLQGSTGCLQALQEARRLLELGNAQRVLVVGVDTWLTNPSIQQALLQNRLLTSEKSDGFIPGEGAAVILVGPPTSAPGPKLALCGIGKADEPATYFSEEPCIGKGLGKALGDALREAGFAAHETHLRVSLTSGEEYFFTEAAYAWSRVLRQPQPPAQQLLLPAASVGEIGAASGVLAMAYVWHLHRMERLVGPHALICLSSSSDKRGAIAAIAI